MNTQVRRGFLMTCGGLLALAAAYLLYLARGVLLLLFAAIIVAEAIAPAVSALRRRGLSFGGALACLYVLIITGTGLLAWRLEDTLGADLSGGAATLGEIQQQLQSAATGAQPMLRALFTALSHVIGRAVDSGATSTPRQTIMEVRAAATAAFAFLSVLVLSAYWLAEQAKVKRLILMAVPERHRRQAGEIWDDIADQFGVWARGEVILMLIIAVPFGVALAIVGSPYPILLAMFAGIVGVIPVVGSIIGPAPAVLLALTRGLAQGLFVLGIGVLLQLLEGIVIGPRLMSRLTGVSPFVVLCGVIFGAAIDGATGAFVAVPLAAIAAVALRHAGLAPRRSEITLAETRRADTFESAPPVPIAPR